MAAVRAIGSNVKDLITDAHAMRMLVYVITNYAAKQKDANYRAFWDELANSALHCQQSQLTFLELIDSLAYKLKPTKGTNNLLALYSHKHQQQNEDAGSFLERMQRDSSVLDDTLSEAECVQIFINNLTDIIAYSTRLQERQQNGLCSTWQMARELVDDISRKSFHAGTVNMRFHSQYDPVQENVVMFTSEQQSGKNKQSSNHQERIAMLLEKRPVLLVLGDSLEKRRLKCLKFTSRAHVPKYCRTTAQPKCHICGKPNHEGDACMYKHLPPHQW